MRMFSAANRRLVLWVVAGLALGLCLAWLANVIMDTGAERTGGAHPLAVISVSPEDGTESAAVTSIKLVFNRPVDLDSVRMHWKLTPSVEGTFRSNGNAVLFVPAHPFAGGSRVTVLLGPGVTSEDSPAQLASGMSWTFGIRQPNPIFLTPSAPPHRLMMAPGEPGAGPTTPLADGEQVSEFSVSPDGAQLALVMANSAGGSEVWTLRLGAPGSVQRTTCGEDACRDPVWLPDRAHLAYTRVGRDGSSTVWLLPLGAGQPGTLLADPQLRAQHPVWSPDGSQVAFYDLTSGTLRLHNFETGHDLRFHTLNGLVGSWSPDGDRMVVSVLDISQEPPVGTLYVIDATTGETTPLPLGGLTDAGNPVWSPAGNWIAFSARVPAAGPGRGMWIVHPDGTELTAVANLAGFAFGGPAWDAWGDALLFQGISLESADAAPDVYAWRSDGGVARVVAHDAFSPVWLP